MNSTLSIDTSSIKELLLVLTLESGETKEKKIPAKAVRSQAILGGIVDLLSENNMKWNNLTEISVATGPGSFTGLKVGAAVGATISWLVNIPINGLPPGTIPEISYGEDKWKLSE